MPLDEQDKQEIAQLIARAIADAKEPPPQMPKPPPPTRFMVAGADINTLGHAGPTLPQIVNLASGFTASQPAGTGNQLNVSTTTALHSGNGTITAAAKTVAITHSCASTPAASDITITPTSTSTVPVGNWWVDTIGATTFTVNVTAAPGVSTWTFGWCARIA